jgi:2',3'-cyclic-nucleotide 2'-phosphodiesterase (5'-nucleotidase family)
MPIRRRLAALVLLLCMPLAAEIRSLTILHTNDLHARLMPLDNHNGGFAYLATAIRQARAHCNDCILLNVGDLVQGSPVSTIFHGLPVFEVANLLGYDAATLGNHDFDYGWPQTRKFIQTANYPIVSCNVVNSKGQLFTPKPYVILTVNKLRVAVIGVMTDDLPTLSTPKLIEDWHPLPAVATASKLAAELRSQSDLVVVVGHINPAEEAAFLNVPDIPVIVSGHIHSGLTEARTNGGRVMVRTKSYGEELGKLELQVDTEKKAPASFQWTRIPVDSTKIAPAPDVAEAVKHWEAEVTARVDQPLAVSKRKYNKVETKRLIEQALRDETGADFAWMNLGGVRDTVPEGQLLVRNIWDMMPFDNVVVVGTFKGRDLPPVVVGDRKIDPDKDYTLAVSDFTAANQQTPENFRTTGLKFPNELGLMRDILIDWFRKKKVVGD